MAVFPDNPFYNNHVFTEYDLLRKELEITKLERIVLLFLPTYVQINDGYAWFYKVWRCRWYLLDYHKVVRNQEKKGG